jgi:hypothetical protein
MRPKEGVEHSYAFILAGVLPEAAAQRTDCRVYGYAGAVPYRRAPRKERFAPKTGSRGVPLRQTRAGPPMVKKNFLTSPRLGILSRKVKNFIVFGTMG